MPGYSLRGLLQTRQSSFSKISDIPEGLEKSTLEHRKKQNPTLCLQTDLTQSQKATEAGLSLRASEIQAPEPGLS